MAGLGTKPLDYAIDAYHIADNMRVVLDTNVLYSALASPSGASAEVLRAARRDKVMVLASVPLFVEYEAVLTRTDFLEFSGLTTEDVQSVLDVLAKRIEVVEPFFLWRPSLQDPDDEMVLECAVNGRADALVTFNLRHFVNAARKFSLLVLRPSELLERIA
jgi:putative PIN family toxin of toxin-antitoxin system